MDVPIGIRRVVLSALARPNVSPPPKLSLPGGIRRALTTLHRRLRPASFLLSPFRASTALFNLRFQRIANTTISVVVFLLIYTVPTLAGEVQELVAVQVGVYTDPINAKRAAAHLKQAGFRLVTQSTTDKEAHHGQ